MQQPGTRRQMSSPTATIVSFVTRPHNLFCRVTIVIRKSYSTDALGSHIITPARIATRRLMTQNPVHEEGSALTGIEISSTTVISSSTTTISTCSSWSSDMLMIDLEFRGLDSQHLMRNLCAGGQSGL